MGVFCFMVIKNLIKVYYVFLVFIVVFISMVDCFFVVRGFIIIGKSVLVLIIDFIIFIRIRGIFKNICK